MPKQKRSFIVEIEAKLTVHAFDEASARKKVQKTFAPGRSLSADVEAGDGVWSYAVVPSATRRGDKRRASPNVGRGEAGRTRVR